MHPYASRDANASFIQCMGHVPAYSEPCALAVQQVVKHHRHHQHFTQSTTTTKPAYVIYLLLHQNKVIFIY